MRFNYPGLGVFASALGALTAAAFASLCCAGPAVLVVLGVGGATAAAFLVPYRPHLLAAAAVLLALGFWRVYRSRRAPAGASCPVRVGRPLRATLWAASAVTVAVALLSALTAPGGAAAEYLSLREDADPLRSAFNADIGKVRVVMLLSPS